LRQAPHSSPSTTTSSTPSSRPKRRDRATPPIVTDCYSFTLPLFYSFTLLLFHSSTLLLPTSSSPLDLNSSQTQQALLPPRRLLPLLIHPLHHRLKLRLLFRGQILPHLLP